MAPVVPASTEFEVLMRAVRCATMRGISINVIGGY